MTETIEKVQLYKSWMNIYHFFSIAYINLRKLEIIQNTFPTSQGVVGKAATFYSLICWNFLTKLNFVIFETTLCTPQISPDATLASNLTILSHFRGYVASGEFHIQLQIYITNSNKQNHLQNAVTCRTLVYCDDMCTWYIYFLSKVHPP